MNKSTLEVIMAVLAAASVFIWWPATFIALAFMFGAGRIMA